MSFLTPALPSFSCTNLLPRNSSKALSTNFESRPLPLEASAAIALPNSESNISAPALPTSFPTFSVTGLVTPVTCDIIPSANSAAFAGNLPTISAALAGIPLALSAALTTLSFIASGFTPLFLRNTSIPDFNDSPI